MKTKTKRRPAPDDVSELTTNRLSIYLRCLDHLQGHGVKTISSGGLASQFNLNAAQIRKDLAWFGEFGVRGVGYSVEALSAHLREILGLGSAIRVAVVGAGNLGQALADYPGFPRVGFEPVALFDKEPSKIGKRSRGGVPIHDIRRMRSIVKREKIRIAMIAVPGDAAQRAVNQVIAAGISAILNFAPGRPVVPPDVKMKDVDLTVSLEGLAYHLAQQTDGKKRR